MKKFLYIIAALLLSATVNSCGEDWLSVESHDKIYIEDYYVTPERIKEALVAAYDPLQWFDYGLGTFDPIPLIYELMGDDFYPGGSNNKDMEIWHLMFNYESIPTMTPYTVWDVAYSGINRSNCVAKYMPSVVGIDDQTKALFIAESEVLRNWYYTQVWKLWGNIPYYEENLAFPYICPQSTADEVYGKMVASLEKVIDSNVLPMRRTSEVGRVTQAMAMMLYADIVMYQNKNQDHKQKALDYMEAIIDSPDYSLVSPADLLNMWEPAGEWSSESIFEINYTDKDASRSWNGPLVSGGTFIPELLSPRNLKGSSKYIEIDAYEFFQITPMAAKAFEAGDIRKDVTIYRPDSEGATYEARYQDTGNFLAKYCGRKDGNALRIGGDPVANFNNNVRLYRYAETLLNAAELIAVHGCKGKGSADAYLNEVRTRAGLGSVGANEETILQERHVEFMGEGKRYWDLVRLGHASTVLVPANDEGGFRVNAWNENKKYLPIPQSEIDAAQGTLTQNNY
ncbi:MAG: RagB/SusD family nutrient uptake outer membrane protein [Bacteroidales bacterium]|nr:RagB/SusD family nutrient uptake outer membrane protein [Bacteroidales bacterium]